MTDVTTAKDRIRHRVWTTLQESDAAVGPAHGKIPDFCGSEQAATRLAGLPEWTQATIIKTVPDKPQQPVRKRALTDKKLVYMAVPKLAATNPFYVLDPTNLLVTPELAATKKYPAQHSPTVDTDAMEPIDLIIVGSVAVNPNGARLGKGRGYADIEIALLTEAELITDTTVIATTVHDGQILDEHLPETRHDFRLDLIVTPERTIRISNPKRVQTIDWASLPQSYLTSIPSLKRRL